MQMPSREERANDLCWYATWAHIRERSLTTASKTPITSRSSTTKKSKEWPPKGKHTNQQDSIDYQKKRNRSVQPQAYLSRSTRDGRAIRHEDAQRARCRRTMTASPACRFMNGEWPFLTYSNSRNDSCTSALRLQRQTATTTPSCSLFGVWHVWDSWIMCHCIRFSGCGKAAGSGTTQ